jgi:hypothetical protein
MPTDVIMPQMGESIFEGTLTKWLKKAGDRVEKDEPLFEISTDKVDAEIPSPVAGVLSEIKVPEGETVEVNTVARRLPLWAKKLKRGRLARRARQFQRLRLAEVLCPKLLPLRRRRSWPHRRWWTANAYAPHRWCGRLPRNTIST